LPLKEAKMKKNYPSDLSNLEWEQIRCFFETDYKTGRRPKHDKRQIVNAIFYVARTGCQWTYLPKDFPPWKTVYTYFWTWQKQGLFEKLYDELRRLIRALLGRHEEPSAAIVDSQSTKTTERGALKVLTMGKRSKGGKDL
jgi:putative transposase